MYNFNIIRDEAKIWLYFCKNEIDSNKDYMLFEFVGYIAAVNCNGITRHHGNSQGTNKR